jgi:hypothetical protein
LEKLGERRPIGVVIDHKENMMEQYKLKKGISNNQHNLQRHGIRDTKTVIEGEGSEPLVK